MAARTVLKKLSRDQWITLAWVSGFIACALLAALIVAIVVVSEQLLLLLAVVALLSAGLG